METIDKENQIKELYLQKETLKKKMQEKLYEFDVKIWNLENSSGKSKRTNNRFIKKCGVDECKGFLSSQWKCGLCETHSCNECHEIIGKRINDYKFLPILYLFHVKNEHEKVLGLICLSIGISLLVQLM